MVRGASFPSIKEQSVLELLGERPRCKRSAPRSRLASPLPCRKGPPVPAAPSTSATRPSHAA